MVKTSSQDVGIREKEIYCENFVSQVPANWAYLLAAASRYLLMNWCCLIIILTFVIPFFQENHIFLCSAFLKNI